MPQTLYHRFTLSSRDIEELLLERSVAVTRESGRTWCIKRLGQKAAT
ncbi:putative transposase [Deinococcus humi]|uniref:Putative transposase n=1 Tax=Deinococcus humi TaxID=662880 RepID=A0A7W8K0B8_9DEIO|nr:putative transposase [Deinococcus humi]